MPLWSVTDAFAHYGAKCKNVQWSWSARSEDEKTVVLTVWKDLFNYRVSPPLYDAFSDNIDEWIDRLGNDERLENLIHARANCKGFCRAVIVVARDTQAVKREAIQRFPQDNMLLRLTEINEATGEFRAVVEDARKVLG